MKMKLGKYNKFFISKTLVILAFFLLGTIGIGCTQSKETQKEQERRLKAWEEQLRQKEEELNRQEATLKAQESVPQTQTMPPVTTDLSDLEKEGDKYLSDLEKMGGGFLKTATEMAEEELRRTQTSPEVAPTSKQEVAPITAVTPVPEDVKIYLLKFRDITNQASPSPEEKMIVMMSKATGEIDSRILDSLIAKCSSAAEQISKLIPPEECKEVHELGIKFYQLNRDSYMMLKKTLVDKLPPGTDVQGVQSQSEEIKEIGMKLDSLRRQLHQKYNLGKL